MTPDQFTAALQTIGWSQRQLVALLECDTILATRWSRGTAAIPPRIERWLTKLVACHERNPVPTDWRVR
jgi:hypothetical protein